MSSGGQLLFGNLPRFPVLWALGLLGFLAVWWYGYRSVSAVRRLFLGLWLPAGVVASVIYSLDGYGYAVSESLRLLVHRDPVILGLAHWVPANGFHATYAAIVGGAIAALATMALQLLGLLLGGLLGLVPAPRFNSPRPPRPGRRSGTPAGSLPRR